MNIYVGNLSNDITEDDLRKAFEAFGPVTSIKIIKDRFTSESKGFGFIEMPGKQEAQAAMDELNGTELKGKAITVNEAKPRTENRRGGGSGSGGGGGRQRSGGGGGGGYQKRY
jgi:RNA recognition motif-containing protein